MTDFEKLEYLLEQIEANIERISPKNSRLFCDVYLSSSFLFYGGSKIAVTIEEEGEDQELFVPIKVLESTESIDEFILGARL